MDTKDKILIKIREWEKERDRCLSIHCPLVAAKYQRWIDKAKADMDESEGNMKNSRS